MKVMVFEITSSGVSELMDVALPFRARMAHHMPADNRGDEYLVFMGYSELAVYNITRKTLVFTANKVRSSVFLTLLSIDPPVS